MRHICLSLMITSLFFTSCASTTVINSQPTGAKIYMNGAYMGVTPYTHSDTKIVGSSTHIQLKKAGCQEQNIIMTRDEKFSVGPFIGGLFVLVPFLWIMSYDPMRTYELECGGNRASDENEQTVTYLY